MIRTLIQGNSWRKLRGNCIGVMEMTDAISSLLGKQYWLLTIALIAVIAIVAVIVVLVVIVLVLIVVIVVIIVLIDAVKRLQIDG